MRRGKQQKRKILSIEEVQGLTSRGYPRCYRVELECGHRDFASNHVYIFGKQLTIAMGEPAYMNCFECQKEASL